MWTVEIKLDRADCPWRHRSYSSRRGDWNRNNNRNLEQESEKGRFWQIEYNKNMYKKMKEEYVYTVFLFYDKMLILYTFKNNFYLNLHIIFKKEKAISSF
jgi:hypothetical protein